MIADSRGAVARMRGMRRGDPIAPAFSGAHRGRRAITPVQWCGSGVFFVAERITEDVTLTAD
jgi:hypothetical protein